jgi:Cysteine sulfinate desulfinase/cysteine desulfurase and related enzymes
MDRLIYLDNNATTPLDPRVLDAMMPYLTTHFANASSVTHRAGREAAAAVEHARECVASLIGASSSELTFTSGATEAINMVLKGVYERYQTKGRHFITCQTEHKAVLDTFAYLEKQGAEVSYLPVSADGTLDLAELDATIRADTVLVALMQANNETGVLHPVRDIAEITAQRDVLFFCDATQAAGKVPINVAKTGIDLLCLSGHKFYGPKGAGALYIKRKSRRIQTGILLHGGGQENKLRAGTLNVPGIVGFGKAAILAREELETDSVRLAKLRDQLEKGLTALPATFVNGVETARLPNVSNVAFRHLRADQVMVSLPDIAVASGSACVSGTRDPSHVLKAMGLSDADAHASIRFSLGRFTTPDDIRACVAQVTASVSELRSSSPIWQLHASGLVD